MVCLGAAPLLVQQVGVAAGPAWLPLKLWVLKAEIWMRICIRLFLNSRVQIWSKYCMSRKSWPILYSKLLYRMSQDLVMSSIDKVRVPDPDLNLIDM